MLAAATNLLLEKGPDGVTIAEVSKLANVSVGGIYGRFGSRATLIQVTHAEELKRITANMLEALSPVKEAVDGHIALQQIVATYVRELRTESRLIRALVDLATSDDTLSKKGVETYAEIRNAMVNALRTAALPTKISSRWGEWIFEIIFSLTLGHLESGAPPEKDTDFIADLGHTVAALVEINERN